MNNLVICKLLFASNSFLFYVFASLLGISFKGIFHFKELFAADFLKLRFDCISAKVL